MTNAFRRGEIAGSQVAQEEPGLKTDEAVRERGRCGLAQYKADRYAHIEPDADFLSGFVCGYRTHEMALAVSAKYGREVL